MTSRADLKILAVEDREVMLKIIKRLLEQMGYQNVDTALNGLQAMEHISKKRYDLIVSDWNMEGMSGFELLKKVRTLPRTSKTPFLLVTAEAKQDSIRAAKKAGADGYLLKPFKLDDFERTINEVLSGKPGRPQRAVA